MIEGNNQRGSAVVGLLVVALLVAIGAAGYFAYQARQQAGGTQATATPAASSDKTINDGWVEYKSTALGISFEMPKGWYVEEETDHLTIKNYEEEYNKGSDNVPADLQILLIWKGETASAEAENLIKNADGSTEITGKVKQGSLKAGSITMNTYEFTSAGPSFDAFWSIGGNRYQASNASEVGDSKQDAMIVTLKKLLPTVKPL